MTSHRGHPYWSDWWLVWEDSHPGLYVLGMLALNLGVILGTVAGLYFWACPR